MRLSKSIDDVRSILGLPRANRRGVLKSAFAALLLATSAASVMPFGAALAETPADTLVIAKNIDDLITLDPAEVYELSGGEVVNNLYDRLLTFDPSDFTKLIGGAVESWEISDDAQQYTFKIRDGLVFSSGRPLTAGDAAFSLQRVVQLGKTPAFILTQFGWTKQNVTSQITAPDDKTLLVKVDKPYAPELFLKALSSAVAAVVDKEDALAHQEGEDLGYAWLKTHSAGSGPYELVAWKPNEAVVLAANPNYKRETVALKSIIVRHVPEAATQRLLLEKGDVDIARNLNADQIAALSSNADISVVSSPKTNIRYLALNQAVEPLKNPKVQQALRWAIDYEAITRNILKGQFVVHQSFWGKGSGGSLDETPYHLDIAKAKSLLAEAGYPDGFPLKLDAYNSSPDKEAAQAIQATFQQAGIKVELNAVDRGQVTSRYRARQHEAGIVIWSPDYLDVHSSAEFFTVNTDDSDASPAKNAAWRNHWLIPELSAETREGLLERDPEKRAEIYLDLQKEVRDNSPLIVLYQEIEQAPVRTNVKDFILGPSWDTPVYWRARKG